MEKAAKNVGSKLVVVVGWLILIVAGASLLEYVRPWAQDQYENWIEGDPYLKVWVNPEARVYYGPGDKAYGNTLPGFYLSQADARSVGYRSTNSWDIGYGRSARPLRTKFEMDPFAESKLSWIDGDVTLYLRNKSNWEIREVTVWVSVESRPQRTYRLTGQAMPKSEAVFALSGSDSPDGRKWSWGFSKIRGFPP